MKQFTLAVLLILSGFALKAQDNIYLKKGEVLDVHVKKISGNLIYYTAAGGGPQRYVRKDAVERIVYKSGREVFMKDPAAARRHGRQQPLSNNMLTVSPGFFFIDDITGLGIGLDYEHYFGERHKLSVHIPVYVGYGSDQQTDIDGRTIYYPYNEVVPFYTAPGIRFHPVNPRKRADYAVGLSVIVGNVNLTRVYESGFGTNFEQSTLLSGITIDNDLNLTSRKKIVFGIHTAVGPLLGEYGNGKWMVQFGLKLGRRF